MGVLDGKTALVTGGGRGIGRAIAERLGRDGARVGIHYGHNEKAALEAVSAITGDGGEAFAMRADFTASDAASQIRQNLEQHADRLDVLVNNAGIGDVRKPMADVTEAEFDRLFSVNAKAVFFVTQALLPILRDGGRVINMSANLTRGGVEGYLMTYAMSKAPIDTFTVALAKELGPRGVTVNAVAPGVIDTDMNTGWLGNEQARAFVSGLSPLGRVAKPTDVADVVAFLASSDSGWLTGQRIEASGGAGI
ncbi:short-chain dehydrogenase [Enemella dayhoffiae]|uniref:Short-chain dehydrogenase n=1 Tax=Enemella dayhoffiae TaxID=2016507 RepID=A0A255GUT8_9ACTN|nr:SDR family oxidoreductase [Enemella dayhoffiae]OYO18556.1 short-chain dehydrogenase [Enemella dayhoffiae]